MESIYLVIVVILIILAISDLVVGVSNDAVNFLNSAIGARVAPVKVILFIASIGILVGATFSSGLMEVARKGIFHPDQFFFNEIMIIFLAVMITDIILLDFFNTFSLPTSTTVSIVFELLGAAVVISIIKIYNSNESMLDLGKYINSEKALAIISGILLSVFIAFLVGAFVQYMTRLLFTFHYKRKLKFFGSLWGGLAITAITYFILIKGLKGSSFISAEDLEWVKSNTILIISVSFIGWSILLQILSWTVNLNIPKVIILIGTFALAMAFAGNDLVNFIGVPLAGLNAYQEYTQVGHDQFLMTALTQKIQTPTVFLLIAGAIMTLTLWFSKKARSMSRTELGLASQGEATERFGSTLMSRSVVKIAVSFNNGIKKIIPEKTLNSINRRFDNSHLRTGPDGPAFDQIRASSNLTVASILIATATTLKLPLSTTYVTFMVAMGTSLSDRAWGRESAVYRITGVFTVIGGWFMTALTAFIVSGIFALFIYYTEIVGIIILVTIAAIVIIRTQIIFKKKEKVHTENEQSLDAELELSNESIITKGSTAINEALINIPELLGGTFEGLYTENLKALRKANKKALSLNQKVKDLKANVHVTIQKLDDESGESGHFYVQAIDYLREIGHCMAFITTPSYEHIDNNHKPFIEAQNEELTNLWGDISSLYSLILEMIREEDYSRVDLMLKVQQDILDTIEKLKKNQIKRIKKSVTGTRNSLLFLSILEEVKNILLHTINLVKSQRDFIQAVRQSDEPAN